jgi:MFS transporter, SP family, galactose:H+ symporter
MPDTARWYMLKGRVAEARRTLRQVVPDRDVDRELAAISRALQEERGGLVREMLRPPYLRATIFVVTLGFFIQITGINAIVYYSPRLFEAMGLTGNFALLVLPALVQVVALIAVFVSLRLVDRLGRRPILLSGIGIMVVANALLVGVFAVRSGFGGALTALGFVGVVLFTVGFTCGFGALVWVYAGESFPARLRSMGSSAMLTSDLVANAIVAGIFLTMLNSLGGAATFAVFGALAVASFAFVRRFAPETKGRQLEDIRHFWENAGRWPTEQAAVVAGPR